MTKPIWHSGPPPSLGWWPASHYKVYEFYRWWNGEYWSRFAHSSCTIEHVGRRASQKAPFTKGIQWAERPKSWPARSKT